MINDRYQLIREIGSGSFGQVYLAIDKQDDQSPNKSVAIKSMSKKKFGNLINMNQNHSQEFSILKFLSSQPDTPKGIIRYLRDYETETSYNLVTEFYSGRNLETPDQHSLTQLISWARDLSSILIFLHGLNIYHLDLKPENLMITGSGELILLDFGFSKRVSLPLAKSYQSGTPYFMSPERLCCQKIPPDQLSYLDIYSFGVTFFFLSNNRTYPHDANNYNELVKFKKFNPPLPSKSGNSMFDLLIDNCLATKIEHRPNIQYVNSVLNLVLSELEHPSN